MSWAVCDGDLKNFDTTNVTRWKHKFGFHNRGVGHPVTRWAGEVKRMQKMVRHPPDKQDVSVALMKMLRATINTSGEDAWSQQLRDLDPRA